MIRNTRSLSYRVTWVREKQIMHINTFTWDFFLMYTWTYFQRRDRDTDVENRCIDMGGREGRVGWTERLGLTLCMCAKSLQSCPTLCDFTACSLPGSSVHGILRWEYWSGLPFPPPGALTEPGVRSNPSLLHLLHWQTGSLPLVLPGKPHVYITMCKIDS